MAITPELLPFKIYEGLSWPLHQNCNLSRLMRGRCGHYARIVTLQNI